MKVAVSVVALFALATVSIPGAAAQGELEFVELVGGDDGDMISFLDIVSVSIAEPGDGTFVLRGEVGSFDQPDDGLGTFFFGFTAAGLDIVSGFDYDGTPNTRNIGEPIPPASCEVDGSSFGFCVYPYSDLAVGVGSVISQVWAFTDGCVPAGGCLPQDVAPGGNIESWPASSFGIDYQLTGCTVVGGCSGGDELPAVRLGQEFFDEISDEFVTITSSQSEPSSDTYVYNWTTENVSFNATTITQVVNGSAQLTIVDGSGTTLMEALYTADFNSTESFENVTPGNWTILVEYDAFVGNFALTVAPTAPPPADDGDAGDDDSGETHSDSDAGSGDDDHAEHDGTGVQDVTTDSANDEGSSTPGFGIVGLLALLGAAFVARRR